MQEIDKWKKYAREGVYATFIGIVLLLIGAGLYSITETRIIMIENTPMPLAYRPYSEIGGLLIYFGFACFIGGIASNIYYDHKLKKFLRGE